MSFYDNMLRIDFKVPFTRDQISRVEELMVSFGEEYINSEDFKRELKTEVQRRIRGAVSQTKCDELKKRVRLHTQNILSKAMDEMGLPVLPVDLEDEDEEDYRPRDYDDYITHNKWETNS